MKTLKVSELKGQKLYGFAKENNQLLMNIEGEGWTALACSQCGNTKMFPNIDLRECHECGHKEIAILKFDLKEAQR